MDSIDEQSKITIIKVEDLCKELEECSGPRLRISQLNQEIRDGLTLLSSLSKRLLLLADNQNRISDARSLQERAQALTNMHDGLQIFHRKANLQSKRNLDQREREEREELLSIGSSEERERALRQRTGNNKTNLVEKSVKLTRALEETLQMMNTEIARNDAVNQTLGESTQTVKNIVNQGRMMEDELGKSKTVQSHIRRKEMMTRMSVYVGLFIFILTILYLIWKRIWIPGSSSSTSSKPLQNSIPHEQPEGVKMKLEDLDESCVFGFCL